MKNGEKKYLIFGSIVIAGTISLSIVLLGIVFQDHPIPEKVPEPPARYILIDDEMIFPEYITGMSIQKYAAATLPEEIQGWVYVVRIHGPGQEIPFDSREDAEEFMIMLAAGYGI